MRFKTWVSLFKHLFVLGVFLSAALFGVLLSPFLVLNETSTQLEEVESWEVYSVNNTTNESTIMFSNDFKMDFSFKTRVSDGGGVSGIKYVMSASYDASSKEYYKTTRPSLPENGSQYTNSNEKSIVTYEVYSRFASEYWSANANPTYVEAKYEPGFISYKKRTLWDITETGVEKSKFESRTPSVGCYGSSNSTVFEVDRQDETVGEFHTILTGLVGSLFEIEEHRLGPNRTAYTVKEGTYLFSVRGSKGVIHVSDSSGRIIVDEKNRLVEANLIVNATGAESFNGLSVINPTTKFDISLRLFADVQRSNVSVEKPSWISSKQEQGCFNKSEK